VAGVWWLVTGESQGWADEAILLMMAVTGAPRPCIQSAPLRRRPPHLRGHRPVDARQTVLRSNVEDQEHRQDCPCYGRFEMRRSEDARVVLVTCENLAEGRKIAKAVVEKKLAACVNLVSAPVESVYRWKGKVECAKEFLLLIKTTGRRVKELETEIARLHSYEVPEFLVLRVVDGLKRYLEWLVDEVR